MGWMMGRVVAVVGGEDEMSRWGLRLGFEETAIHGDNDIERRVCPHRMLRKSSRNLVLHEASQVFTGNQ